MIYPPAQSRPGTHKHHGNRKPQLSQGHITWGGHTAQTGALPVPCVDNKSFQRHLLSFLGGKLSNQTIYFVSFAYFLQEKKKGNEVKPNRTVRVTKTKFIHTAFLLDQNIRTNVMVWFVFIFFFF